MGKTKGRRTRWRALNITDGQYNSDSDEESIASLSNNNNNNNHFTQHHFHRNRNHNNIMKPSYHNHNNHNSSQPTTTATSRRYDVNKSSSTRSSSTASERKITFNEDEYTRITTPRQDVLFKKGYLNKPRTYQTQTSTGNSTTSTGNSTGNGTPDHQSTGDLEYESQFVFPNGFVDQNGIYFINGFEPYPLMVFNPPTYYQEFSNVRKRDSTGSLTESIASPNPEGTVENNVSDGVDHLQGDEESERTCQEQETDVERHHPTERHRRLSQSSLPLATPPPSEEGVSTTSDQSVSSLSEMSCEETKAVESNEEPNKYNLKPDAEEFIPRALRLPTTLHYVPQPAHNFVPISLAANGAPYLSPPPPNTAIPVNFIPTNYVNFIPMQEHVATAVEEIEEIVIVPGNNKNQIDIAKIVSKLEEAAKEQDQNTHQHNGAKEEKSAYNTKRRNFRNRSRYQKEEVINSAVAPQKTWNNKNRYESRRKVATPPPILTQQQQSVKNYSDTLKKAQRPPASAQKTSSNNQTQSKKDKAPETPVKPAAPNQWISVSNRKSKRRNKNVEDMEEMENGNREEVDKDLFESYDVNLLEDVVVKPIEVMINEEMIEEAERVEDTPKKIEVEELPPQPTEEAETKEDSVTIEAVEEEIQAKTPKKKSKKKTKNPSVVKRVIITDNLRQQPAEDEVLKIVEIVEDKPKEEEEEEVVPTIVEEKIEEIESTVVQNEAIEEEPTEMKEERKPISSKKKKKKSSNNKSSVISSMQDPMQQLIEDTSSYDFLLIEPVSSDDKTNIEVSQELDKMIQRGMYSNLEEKIKSLNIESNQDDFFKNLMTNISRESSVEPINQDMSKVTSIVTNKPKSVILEPVRASPPRMFQPQREEDLATPLRTYPIMSAVKDWMSKTKETSPELPLLKSPDDIAKEFGNEEESCEEIEENDATDCESTADVVLKKSDEARFPKHGNLPYRAICCSIM